MKSTTENMSAKAARQNAAAAPAKPEMMPPTVKQVIDAISEDASEQPNRFLDEVVVPHGGE